MISLNYRIDAIIGAVIGVSLLLGGAWGAYGVIPDGGQYSYVAYEQYEDPADAGDFVIQFENLSDEGKEIFLASIKQDGKYRSDTMAPEVDMSVDTRWQQDVEYRGKVYHFQADYAYSGMYRAGVTIFGLVALTGLLIAWPSIRTLRKN